MSFLKTLEEFGHSEAPIFYEFLFRYDPKKKQVFAFYEGDEDSSFYNELIAKQVNENCEIESIVVGCKNEVIKLFRNFDWNQYNCHQIAFFVDRDLSYWLDENVEFGYNVFVTDEYSVENYVANSTGFKIWLCQFEGFARAKKLEIEHMIQVYEEISEVFNNRIMSIMATAVVAKKRDKSIRLQDYKIPQHDNLFYLQSDNRIELSDLSIKPSIMEKWGITSDDSDAIEKQIELFKSEKEQYSVRGKWALTFMAELGEFMRLNVQLFAPSLQKMSIKPTCSVSTNQCLSVLGPYCTKNISHRLETFFQRTYGQYCKTV